MATISTYVSGHTEQGDVAEFFQKQLLSAGERPIAFFDGVFYESHQERVGNIAYQDYLVYSDRAVYLWARGATKDYLDRFALGSVSINSRNKDNDFATLNLRIRREEREPVYVIFDMVEIDEAEKINALHTIIESIVENHLGNNFRKEIPDEVAEQIFISARNTCPPRPLTFRFPEDQAPGHEQGSQIGYGQDLLEQYKASIGYTSEERPATPGSPPRRQSSGSPGQTPPGIPKELENVLPTDPEALKRIAANLKDAIGDAPFKFRDQVMKDLRHIPGDVATVLTAVNELLSNIADNPKAERFVLNAIQTAVKNDGILGSMGKMLKLTTGFGPMGKKAGAPQSADHAKGGSRSAESGDEGSVPTGDGEGGTIRRKKVRIQADNGGSVPDVSKEVFDPALGETGGDVSSAADPGGNKAHSRKIKVKTEDGDIPRVVEEQLREALRDVGGLEQAEPDTPGVSENREIVRKKIAIQNEPVENSQVEESQSTAHNSAMKSEPEQHDSSGNDTEAQQKKPAKNLKSERPLNKSK